MVPPSKSSVADATVDDGDDDEVEGEGATLGGKRGIVTTTGVGRVGFVSSSSWLAAAKHCSMWSSNSPARSELPMRKHSRMLRGWSSENGATALAQNDDTWLSASSCMLGCHGCLFPPLALALALSGSFSVEFEGSNVQPW